MIQLSTEAISLLKKLIGKRLYGFSANTSNQVVGQHISLMERKLRLHFQDSYSIELSSQFDENEEGEIIHDYSLEENHDAAWGVLRVNLDNAILSRIVVYERAISLGVFGNSEATKNAQTTDSVFALYFQRGPYCLVVLDEFFPTIDVWFDSVGATAYFYNSLSSYTVHYEFK